MLGFLKSAWGQVGVTRTLKQMGFTPDQAMLIAKTIDEDTYIQLRQPLRYITEQQKNLIFTYLAILYSKKNRAFSALYIELEEATTIIQKAIGAQLLGSSTQQENDIAKALTSALYLLGSLSSVPTQSEIDTVKEQLKSMVGEQSDKTNIPDSSFEQDTNDEIERSRHAFKILIESLFLQKATILKGLSNIELIEQTVDEFFEGKHQHLDSSFFTNKSLGYISGFIDGVLQEYNINTPALISELTKKVFREVLDDTKNQYYPQCYILQKKQNTEFMKAMQTGGGEAINFLKNEVSPMGWYGYVKY